MVAASSLQGVGGGYVSGDTGHIFMQLGFTCEMADPIESGQKHGIAVMMPLGRMAI